MINNIMKLIILLIALISSIVSAEELYDFNFKYDESYFKWTPVVDITTTPYWATPIVNKITHMDDLYSVQIGTKYKFDDTSYVVFKTEYPTNYIPGSTTFHFIHNEPTIIFEFRTIF